VGVGALCLRREIALAPLVVGGGQERGRRAGTPDVAAAVGLATALRLAAEGRPGACASTAARRDRLAKLLSGALDGVTPTVAGTDVLPGTCHVLVEGVASEELVFLCDQAGLCVSAASSCASGATTRSHVLAAMGVDEPLAHGSLRLSIGAETSDGDVERAAAIVVDAVRRLRAGPA
jgi:cysteine desulfurase